MLSPTGYMVSYGRLQYGVIQFGSSEYNKGCKTIPLGTTLPMLLFFGVKLEVEVGPESQVPV